MTATRAGSVALWLFSASLTPLGIANGQATTTDSVEIALEAVRFLKTTGDTAKLWNFLHIASPAEIVAFGDPIAAVMDRPFIVAQVAGGAERFGSFRMPAAGWPCRRPTPSGTGTYAVARCALRSSRYYVHIGPPVVYGDKAYVNVLVFFVDPAMRERLVSQDALVEVKRKGKSWTGTRVLYLKM